MSAMESNTDVMEKFGAYSERDATRKKAAKQDKKKRGGGKGKSSQALTAAATSGSNDTKLSGPDVQAPKSKAIVAEPHNVGTDCSRSPRLRQSSS